MKYITFEKNEHLFNLFKDVEHETYTSFWLYDVYGINADISEFPEDLKNAIIELPEEVAKASIFSRVDLTQQKTINLKVEWKVFDWVKHAFNIPAPGLLKPRDKFVYTITEEDEVNSVKFTKIILIDYLEKHRASLSDGNKLRYNSKLNNLKQAIEACKTNYDCHVIMHNHFNYPQAKYDFPNKTAVSLPGAKWNLSRPDTKNPIQNITEEALDIGPTIDNISPDVFTLKWEIGEPVPVNT